MKEEGDVSRNKGRNNTGDCENDGPANYNFCVLLIYVSSYIFFFFFLDSLFTSQYTSRSSSVVLYLLWTIGAHSVQGSSQCPFFVLLLPGLEPRQWQCQHGVPTP